LFSWGSLGFKDFYATGSGTLVLGLEGKAILVDSLLVGFLWASINGVELSLGLRERQ